MRKGRNGEHIFYCPIRVKGGRKRTGPGTAKNYHDRKGANCNGTITMFKKRGLNQYGVKENV